MAESMQLPETLFKLTIRFSNGEKVTYITAEPFIASAITSETRYALVTSCSIQNPAECAEVNLINLSEVAFIKSEKITLEEFASERRTAGLRAQVSSEDTQPKSISQLKFI
jgi:hypothetical protein